MKKIVFLPLLVVFLGLTSCDVVNQLIPDVDQTVSKTFPVVINANVAVGESEDFYVDITQYDEYKKMEQYIQGYSLQKITYEVKDYNAPEDLYFAGTIIATDNEETTSVTVAEIEAVNLSGLATMGGENEMNTTQDGKDQLIMWLEDPGNFVIKFGYSFEDDMGADYSFSEEDFGSSFNVKVSLYLTIITGV